MHVSALDIKSLARERGPHMPSHTMLPPPILAFTQYWLGLADGRTPNWAAFDMFDVAETAPYLTILKSRGEHAVDLEFVGSAITAVAGEDLTGSSATRTNPVVGDMDWFNRARPAIDSADIQVSSGTIHPPYTSAIEYVSADFPFKDETGAIAHIVCVTVAKLN